MNEPPIGVKPSEDSIINVLTPNSLLLGWASTASNPLGWQPYDTNTSSWYHLFHQSVVKDFWKRWTELYVLTLLVQRKWFKMQLAPWRCSNQPDKNTLWGDYCLALVKEVFPREDGKVRRVAIQYIKSYRTGERAHEYRGARDTVVSRAVQCLALLVSAAWSKPVTEVNKCRDYDDEQFADELIFSVRFCFV